MNRSSLVGVHILRKGGRIGRAGSCCLLWTLATRKGVNKMWKENITKKEILKVLVICGHLGRAQQIFGKKEGAKKILSLIKYMLQNRQACASTCLSRKKIEAIEYFNTVQGGFKVLATF